MFKVYNDRCTKYGDETNSSVELRFNILDFQHLDLYGRGCGKLIPFDAKFYSLWNQRIEEENKRLEEDEYYYVNHRPQIAMDNCLFLGKVFFEKRMGHDENHEAKRMHLPARLSFDNTSFTCGIDLSSVVAEECVTLKNAVFYGKGEREAEYFLDQEYPRMIDRLGISINNEQDALNLCLKSKARGSRANFEEIEFRKSVNFSGTEFRGESNL